MKVLILGCGPAGLIAAHSAAWAGHDILILSKPRKSYMNGAQYLHSPILGATKKAPFQISYQLSGTTDGYRDKVYGAGSRVDVSPQSLVGVHPAWDIRQTYDELWNMYGGYVEEFDVYPESLATKMAQLRPDLVVSSVPAKLLCNEGHAFSSKFVWSTDRCMAALKDNTVLCNGEKSFGWYRASIIQGFENTEWPDDTRPPIPQHRLWHVEKPVATTCTCFPSVVRVGRYGKWTKGVLSHEAWEDTLDALHKLEDNNGTASSSA